MDRHVYLGLGGRDNTIRWVRIEAVKELRLTKRCDGLIIESDMTAYVVQELIDTVERYPC